MKLMKIFSTLFSNGLVTATIALGIGVLAMLGLVEGYDAIWGIDADKSIALNESAVLESAAAGGETKTLYVRKIPAPFLSRADGSVLGYVFVDVAIDVGGEDAFIATGDTLDDLVKRYAEILKEEGAGRSDQPGLVDYERLAQRFLTLARDERGLGGIVSVTVSAAEGG